jgi:hypothetical protein
MKFWKLQAAFAYLLLSACGVRDHVPPPSAADGGPSSDPAPGGSAGSSPSKPEPGAKDAGAGPRDAGPGPSSKDAGPKPDLPAPSSGDVSKLDLLFVIDNSNSMAEKQRSLRALFPKLIDALTTGERYPGDPHPFPAAPDLHVGVVSTDMGIPGVNFGSTTNCLPDGGDDGRLQHTPHGDGCDAAYPTFLSYDEQAGSDRSKLANDLSCIAALGTGGCGFEQPLEAPFKALWPTVFTDQNGNIVTPNPISFLATTQQGTRGRGDVPANQGGNLGFLRNDRATGVSLIAIVVVTDEEDCSPRTTEHLLPASQLDTNSPYYEQDINLRCFYNPTLLYDVKLRYGRGLKLLRENNPELVVFAAIAGVPPDLVDRSALEATDFGDASARDRFYSGILDDPRMFEAIDPETNPGTGTGNLRPSCVDIDPQGQRSVAYPPRRIVQLAREFGESGIVQSICQDDFAPAIGAIVDTIARQQEKRTSR